MAATNPFRVSDLIAKYGWQVMPYLSNLGPTLLAEAQVLFVDSGHADASDADDTEHGHSFEKPLATIDYAVDLCTAGERSVILVAPGHNEELGNAQIDFDVSDITCIGIGEGSNKPRIDFDHANSSVDIGANNVHLINLTFMPAITDILVGVDIETGVTGTILEKCDWEEGENAADEFILGVDVKASCEGVKIMDCLFRTKTLAAGCTNAIQLNDASDNIIVQRCRFLGNWSNAAINGITTASTDVLIDDVTIKVADSATGIKMYTGTTGIIRNACLEVTNTAINSMIVADAMAWFNNYGVTADGTAAAVVGGGEVLASLDAAITSPTGASLRDILHKDGSHTYSKTTDSLEAIRDKLDTYASPTDVTAAVPDSPTNKSLQDILSKADGSNNYSKATDSLEAIRDHLDGATVLGGLQLDHLAQTVSAGSNYPTEITTNSILGMIMSTNGNPDQFNKTTDSLEAISVAVAGISDNVTTAVGATPTARSLQDILEKDGTSDFDRATDSLEMLSDKLGAFTGDEGSDVDDSVLASLNLAHTDLDTIIADTVQIAGSTLDVPGAGSLGRYIASGGSSLGQELPSTMSLVDIIGDYAGPYDNAAAGKNIKADLDLVHTDVDAILADTLSISGGTLPATPVSGSLATFISGGSTALGQPLPASRSLVDIIGDYAGPYNGASAGNNIKADVDLAQTDITAILADTDMISGATLPASPTAGSLARFVASGGTSLGQPLPTDMSLIDIIGNFTGAYNATDPDDNIKAALDHLSKYVVDGTGDWASGTALPANKSIYDVLGAYTADGGADDEDTIMAHLDLIKTAADAVLVDTAVIDSGAKRIVTATTTDWNLVATNNMFTVNGLVRAKIWGEVLVQVKAVAMNLKVIATPTAPGGAIDVTANLDCNADAVGTVYKMATTLGGAMVEVTGGVSLDDGIDVILPPGVVQLGSGANEDGGGSIQWFCQYEPLEAGATVTAT